MAPVGWLVGLDLRSPSFPSYCINRWPLCFVCHFALVQRMAPPMANYPTKSLIKLKSWPAFELLKAHFRASG